MCLPFSTGPQIGLDLLFPWETRNDTQHSPSSELSTGVTSKCRQWTVGLVCTPLGISLHWKANSAHSFDDMMTFTVELFSAPNFSADTRHNVFKYGRSTVQFSSWKFSRFQWDGSEELCIRVNAFFCWLAVERIQIRREGISLVLLIEASLVFRVRFPTRKNRSNFENCLKISAC